jgi:hypothetical protein
VSPNAAPVKPIPAPSLTDRASATHLDPDVETPPSSALSREVPPDHIPRSAKIAAVTVGLVVGLLLTWVLADTEGGQVAEQTPTPTPTANEPTSARNDAPAVEPSAPPKGDTKPANTEPETAPTNEEVEVPEPAPIDPASDPTKIPPDAETLPGRQGYLFVESTLDTEVFVHGRANGKTNRWLVSTCGPRFIRLGVALGQWQTEGVVNIVKCQSATHMSLDP